MNLNELKQLLGKGGRIVIVENEKPVMVILGYDDYKNIIFPFSSGKNPENLSKNNQESPSLSNEELTLDDLPL